MSGDNTVLAVTGNPTPEELAAVVAALVVGSAPALTTLPGSRAPTPLWGKPTSRGWVASARL